MSDDTRQKSDTKQVEIEQPPQEPIPRSLEDVPDERVARFVGTDPREWQGPVSE